MRNLDRFFIIESPMSRVDAARLTAHRNFSDLGRVEIDPDAQCQVVDSGIWVQHWVLIPTAEIDDTIRAEDEREG